MESLYFVTSNKNKAEEAEAILGIRIKRADIELPEVQTLDVFEVAEGKARYAYAHIKKPVFVEDTGLYIHSLQGFPGALAKWIDESIGYGWLCDVIKDDRSAHAKCCICFYDGHEAHTFCGVVQGKISTKPCGETNFGWDAIFVPDGHKKTYAEMTKDQKNKISMRRMALDQLKKFLHK